jgi:hypothetical protein
MNEDIIRWAREAGLGTALCHNSIDGDRIWIEGADWHDEVERFAALVAAAEREACAKVCEDASKPREGEMYSDAQWAGLVLAITIRARGNK